MSNPALQPRPDEPVVELRTGRVTRAWADYFMRLALQQSSDDLRSLYEQLAARVAELEEGEQADFRILGQQSISVSGVVQPGGVVIISLENDTDEAGNTAYYGTGPDGVRGWFPLSGTNLVVNGELTKVVGLDGVSTFGLADVSNSGSGALQAITRDAKGRVTGTKAATITGTAQQINVANGTASAGLPTLSLAPEVVTSLGRADSAIQAVQAGTGITVDNTDPRRPVVSAAGGTGIPEAPTDGSIYARGSASWEPLTGTLSRYVLLELPPLLDQQGNALTDQQGRPLYSNTPQIPVSWVIGAQATVKDVYPLSALPPVTPFPREIYVSGTSGVSGLIPAYSDGVNWLRFSDNTPVN